MKSRAYFISVSILLSLFCFSFEANANNRNEILKQRAQTLSQRISKKNSTKPVSQQVLAVSENASALRTANLTEEFAFASVASGAPEITVPSSLIFSRQSYVNNLNQVFLGEFTAPVNALSISLVFSLIDLEANFDFVRVYDRSGQLCDALTGTQSGTTVSVACGGNYASVYVKTDGHVSGADGYRGFQIDGYRYTSPVGNSNTPPVPLIVADSYQVTDGQAIFFDGSQSLDPDASDYIHFYQWEFSDGTESTSPSLFHTFSEPGEYSARLTVYDSHGLSATDTVFISVNSVSKPISPIQISSTGRSITVGWQSGGEDTSGYFVSVSNGGLQQPSCLTNGIDVGLVQSFQAKTLSPSTTYKIAVCAYNEFGRLSIPLVITANTSLVILPPSPIALISSGVQARQFQIAWQSAGGNTNSFWIQNAPGSAVPVCTLGESTSSNQKTFFNLTPNTLYTLAVCSANSDGDTSSPSVIRVGTGAIILPPSPINLNLSDVYANRLTAHWESGGGTSTGFKIGFIRGSVATQCTGDIIPMSTQLSLKFENLDPNTAYTLSVCSLSADGDLSIPAVLPILTPQAPAIPSIPSGLMISNRNMTQMTLSWNSSQDSTVEYRVNIAPGPNPAPCGSQGILTGAQASHTYQGLTQNTLYTLSVCGLNNIGVAGPLASILISTTDSSASPKPTAFVITHVGINSMTMSWNSGGGSTVGYKIAYRTGRSAPGNCNGGLNVYQNSFTLSGLNPFTDYAFRLCSINGLDKATVGPVATKKTLDNFPTNLMQFSGAGRTPTSLFLSWVKIGGQVGGDFLIQSAIGDTAPPSCVGGSVIRLTYNSVEFRGLIPDTEYSYRICGRNGNGIVNEGVTTTYRTLPLPPGDVTGLAVTQFDATSANLIWSSAGGSTTGFRVAYKEGASAPSTCAGGIRTYEPNLYLPGLNPFTLHSFRVCAFDDFGRESRGVIVQATTLDTPAAGVQEFSVSKIVPDALTLAWNYERTSRGGVFQISYRQGMVAPDNCSAGTGIPLTARTYILTKLLPNTYYSFRLCVYNGNNNLSSPGIVLEGIRTYKVAAPDPKSLVNIEKTRSTLKIGWASGGAGTVGYMVKISSGSPDEYCRNGYEVGDAQSFNFTALRRSKGYTMRVCSINEDGVVSKGKTIYNSTSN